MNQLGTNTAWACRICGNTENNRPYRAREMMLGTREPFDYVQCGRCGCLQIAQIPADLSAYYPQHYNGYVPPRTAPFAGLTGRIRKWRYRAATFRQSRWANYLAALLPARQYDILAHVPLRLDSAVVDVGCGAGGYLHPLYSLGMTNVVGIDPFVPPLTYPNGYRVLPMYITELTGRWELILFNHSFEHVPDPLTTLQAVARLLADNGRCIIRIPTVSSWAWAHYGTDWFQLDAPRHLYLHSRASMERLVAQAGLRLLAVVYDSTGAQFSLSERYRAGYAMYEPLPQRPGWLARKWTKWRNGRRARRLNRQEQGDQAAFILARA